MADDVDMDTADLDDIADALDAVARSARGFDAAPSERRLVRSWAEAAAAVRALAREPLRPAEV